jgi:DNA ligase-1
MLEPLLDRSLVLVDTQTVSQEDVTQAFKQYRSLGYEGAMLRDPESLYVGDRSYGLLKVKEFDDSEFKIVNVNEGRGKLKGHAIFECITEDGAEKFEAKLKGETSHLKTIFENPQDYIGKSLTVQYQGRTKNHIPRFPVGLRVRQDV